MFHLAVVYPCGNINTEYLKFIRISKHLCTFEIFSFLTTNQETVCLTLSHIQQICNRWLRKTLKTYPIFILETPLKWKYSNWIELKTWWQKEKLFWHHVFKMSSVVEASKSVYMRERVNKDVMHFSVYIHTIQNDKRVLTFMKTFPSCRVMFQVPVNF